MPTLSVVSFSIVCATLGAFIALFGLVSFLFKEKFFLSETLISTIAGALFSPHVANLIRPLEYAQGNEETLELITLYFSRLVLGLGAVCPWRMFVHNDVIPIYRLIPLGIMVLLFRRPPIVLLMHKRIYQIEDIRQASFVGYFGPIGVSALFYLYLTLEWLRNNVQVDGHEREDAKKLAEILTVVVWFLVICSIFIHGLSIPLGKLGLAIPRTLSRARSDMSESMINMRRLDPTPPRHSSDNVAIPKAVWNIGRSVIPAADGHNSAQSTRPSSPKKVNGMDMGQGGGNGSSGASRTHSPDHVAQVQRSIRFPDEVKFDGADPK